MGCNAQLIDQAVDYIVMGFAVFEEVTSPVSPTSSLPELRIERLCDSPAHLREAPHLSVLL